MSAESHIDRTIATVRQHGRGMSWWVDAAHNLADEVERLREQVATLQQTTLDEERAVIGGRA